MSPSYNKSINFRFAMKSDLEMLIAFIRKHWDEQHIFVNHPALLEWQHTFMQQNAPKGVMTYALAVDVQKAKERLLGILGFITYAPFDIEQTYDDIVLALWKVEEGLSPGIGVGLLKFLEETLAPDLINVIGINNQVKPLYELLGYSLSNMNHFVLLNPQMPMTDFRIAEGVTATNLLPKPPNSSDITDSERQQISELKLDALNQMQIAELDQLAAKQRPRKSHSYLTRRFEQHPWYNYNIWGIRSESGKLETLVVVRSVSANGGRALRLVDMLGTVVNPKLLHHVLASAMLDLNAEYVDVISHGVDDIEWLAAGFIDVSEHKMLVVPNYFEPFIAKNVQLGIAYKDLKEANEETVSTKFPIRIFRSDSDQDRPNQVGSSPAVAN